MQRQVEYLTRLSVTPSARLSENAKPILRLPAWSHAWNSNVYKLRRDPNAFDEGRRPKRWLHTDLMDLPYFYTHRLFERIVREGDMK